MTKTQPWSSVTHITFLLFCFRSLLFVYGLVHVKSSADHRQNPACIPAEHCLAPAWLKYKRGSCHHFVAAA